MARYSGLDWSKVSAAGNVNNPAALFVSGLSRQIILSALESVKPPEVWLGADFTLTGAEIDEIDAAVSAAIEEAMLSMMIGAIVSCPFASEPDWGLFCLGQVVARADYPELWEVYPAGGKTETQLTLPNLAGLVLVGAGISPLTSTNYPVYSTGGEETHVLTEAEIPAHAHTYTQPIPNVDLEAPGVPDIIAAGINPLTAYTGNTGGGQSHNNMQPFAVLNYVIITPKP